MQGARTAIRVREATKGVHVLVEGLEWRGEGGVNERPRLARARTGNQNARAGTLNAMRTRSNPP